MRLCVLSVVWRCLPYRRRHLLQDSMGSDSGLSIAAGGGIALLSEISKAKTELTLEKDGESVGDKTSVELDAAFELGWNANGALGYQFGDVRAEAEFSYLSANLNKLGEIELKAEDYDALPQLTAMSFMANGWYELDTGTPFSPFIGIGLGRSQLELVGRGRLRALQTSSNQQSPPVGGLRIRRVPASGSRSPMGSRSDSATGSSERSRRR